MAFVIRTLSQTAAGRPIIALARVEGDTATIGRDPASDIHLTDLAVTRHHARMLRESGGRVVVEVTDNLPFGIDGRSTERAEIDPATGGELRFGAYRLAISAGNQPGDVVVTVERATDTMGDRHAGRSRFALASVAPGKRPLAWGLALAILAAFLVWPIWSFHAAATAKITDRHGAASQTAGAAWSPGKLSLAHAGLERNCVACHAKAFVAVKEDNCRACHAAVHDHAPAARLAAARVDPGIGARVRLAVASAFGRSPGRCVECHAEHEGATAMAPPQQRFCADCHRDLKQRLPHTHLGDADDFGTLHPQFRPGVVVMPGTIPAIRRVSIDDRPRERTGLVFAHAVHLSAVNSVARMAQTTGQAKPGTGLSCASCHVADGGGGFRPVSMEADCQSCHSLAFGRSNGVVRTLRHGDADQALAELRDFAAVHGNAPPIDAGRRRPGDVAGANRPAVAERADAATRAVFAPRGLCGECHLVERHEGSYRIAPVTMPDHFLLAGTFDHRAHASQACASCHAASRSIDAGEVMIPGIARCRDCHVGAAATVGKVPSPCALCHVYHRSPPAPMRRDHARQVTMALAPRQWP